MIQITAYLRTPEDLALWKALPNKVEFLHQSLANFADAPMKRPKVIYDASTDSVIKHESKSFDLCKHNQIKGFCKQGCK